MCCGHARLCVCLSVRLSAAVRPHYCTDPDVTWQRGRGYPVYALLGGFAIGARVALLWQHNANPSYKLASIPAGRGLRVRTQNVSEYMLVLALCIVYVCNHVFTFTKSATYSASAVKSNFSNLAGV